MESDDGFTVTLKGYRKAAERARRLQGQGNVEAAGALALEPSDAARWECARCLQIEAFTNETRTSGF